MGVVYRENCNQVHSTIKPGLLVKRTTPRPGLVRRGFCSAVRPQNRKSVFKMLCFYFLLYEVTKTKKLVLLCQSFYSKKKYTRKHVTEEDSSSEIQKGEGGRERGENGIS